MAARTERILGWPRAPAAALVLPLFFVVPALALDRTFALRAGKVYTVSGPAIEGGTIFVKDGKIAAVGKGIAVPAGVPTIELPRHAVIPGLIDAETSLTGESSDVQKSVSPEILALDGWDFFADRRVLLKGGVTTVYVAPGISAAGGRPTRLVSGRGCVVKTAGEDSNPLSRVLRRSVGLQVTLGELSKRPPSIYDPPLGASPDNPFEVIPTQLPQSRPGEFLALRTLFDGAGGVPDGVGAVSTPEAPAVEVAAVLPVLRGDDGLRVRANRARDILQILKLSKEYGLKMVLEGGREADRLAPEIAEAGVPVIFAGGFQPGVIPAGDLSVETSEGRYREETLIALVRAGVKVIIHSPTDAEAGDLLLQAASAVRAGLDPAAALRSITLSAAEVLGVADRVGSIEPGKDADLVILGGEPFAAHGKPQAVFISGELAHHEGPRGLGAGVTVVRCGGVLTGKGEEFPGGVVVVEGKKIRYTGPGPLTAQLSPGASVIDATAEVVVPGFIDAGTAAGARAEALAVQAAAQAGSSGAGGRSTFRLADAIDPRDPALRDLVRAGITTVLITPEPSSPIAGQVTAWKLSWKARDEVTIKAYAGLVLRNDVQPQELKKAKEYHERWKTYESKTPREGEAPDRREEYEPFRPVFEKKVPAAVYFPGLDGSPGLVGDLVKEFGMNVVVFGQGRIDRAAEDLRRLGVAALLSVPLVVPDETARVNLPRQAAAAGLRFAFRSGAASGAVDLVPQVAFAAGEGWSGREALAALTIRAAEIFGIDDRVGSIEEGKDADLVFLSGEPFAPGTRVARVMVEGEMRETEARP